MQKSDDASEKGNRTDIKGAELHILIIQKNWYSDGRDKVLDCGVCELDSVNINGPPSIVTVKGTSLPHTAPVRKQKKSKAWEKYHFSGIAKEIAKNNGLKLMFLCNSDPYFQRKEQIKESDISFFKRICKSEGVSLKATAKMLVLFDAADYESKSSVRKIKAGSSDIINYNFSTNFNDTAYAKCRVTYTDPQTQKTIDYTYTPRESDKNGQVLEINEKVASREDARKLAMKRLREKNKDEYQARFTLVGDLDLVAGLTVEVEEFGMFDGKYIIETAVHSLTGGYTVSLTLRRALEGY